MKLTFLGTRGNIDARSRRHRCHSATMVTYGRTRVMIDCGADWLGRIAPLHPDAVVVTHAHPDHAWGLEHGAPCPVYATRESWHVMESFPVAIRRTVTPRRAFVIADIRFQAFPVDHSIRCPAVGYRITAGRVAVFYVPDVVSIRDRRRALAGVRLYIGDGATIVRPMLYPRGKTLIGHAPIRTQLAWCGEQRVPQAVFTHCGTQIVNGDERALLTEIRRMGSEHDVDARLARDGMELVLR